MGVMLLNGCSSASPSSNGSAPFRTPPNASAQRNLRLSEALPSGEVSVAYNSTLSVSRGMAPYNFTISWGALPPGLTLAAKSGTVSGTPTRGLVIFGFGVHVTDSAG